jgi:hypothetical protein
MPIGLTLVINSFVLILAIVRHENSGHFAGEEPTSC